MTFVAFELINSNSDLISHWKNLPYSGHNGSITSHKIVPYSKEIYSEVQFENNLNIYMFKE
jgi:hypothetical protein